MTALLAGWLADELVGDPRRLHPVAGYGRFAGCVERRRRGDDRRAGAVYTVVLVAVPAAVTAVGQQRLPRATRPVWRLLGPALLAVAVWLALGGRSLRREARCVAEAVADGRLEAARVQLPALCGRDPAALDGAGLCRAAIESVAENTADAVVAPLFAGAVAGAAGVVAHRGVNTLDAMVGYRAPGYERFGWAAARLDDVLGWVPARVTAGLMVLAAPAVGGSPPQAGAAWRRDGRRHPSPNAGVCEAAAAGALGVRLGGENRYGGTVETRGPQGDGPAPTPQDVARAARLSAVVGAAAALLAAALGWGLASVAGSRQLAPARPRGARR